jgi:hypothetical protein
VINMAKRRKRKDLKKVETLGDLFEIKVKPMTNKNFEEQLLYHMRTNRCPYNEEECEPNNCLYGDKGMEQCPLHEGTVF